MTRLFFISVLTVLFSLSPYGQETVSSACPLITVNGASGIPDPGGRMIFTATITGGAPSADIVYEWSVSHGTIAKGQGTHVIEVALPKAETITATLRVKGLPSDCSGTASETVTMCPAPTATKLDELTGPIARIEASR